MGINVLPDKTPFTNAHGYHFRGTGVAATIPFGTTANVDYKLTENRMIDGVHLMLSQHVWDDYVKFQVIDVDNILGYGAGTVLDEFASTWNIDPALCSQRHEKISYPAKVIKDLYIRVVYVSTGGVDVKLKANLYLHKVPV